MLKWLTRIVGFILIYALLKWLGIIILIFYYVSKLLLNELFPPKNKVKKGAAPKKAGFLLYNFWILIYLTGVLVLSISFFYGWALMLTSIAAVFISAMRSSSSLKPLLFFIPIFMLFGSAALTLYRIDGMTIPEFSDHAEEYNREVIKQPDSYRLSNPADSIWIQHFRIWENLNHTKHEALLQISHLQALHQGEEKTQIEPNEASMKGYFGQIYQHLDMHTSNSLDSVIFVFDSIQKTNYFTRADFAQLIVSCVQDIPYVWITDVPCESDKSLPRHTPCKGNVKFGLQTQAEFMYDLQGDCDTRSLFLYSVLKYFGYNVAVFISEAYRHAVLGVEIEGGPNELKYKGKAYKAWETTNTGFRPGYLPPSVSDMSLWEVAVSSSDY